MIIYIIYIYIYTLYVYIYINWIINLLAAGIRPNSAGEVSHPQPSPVAADASLATEADVSAAWHQNLPSQLVILLS